MDITRIGGPSVLIEVAGWRILVDPTFDPAGGHYNFGLGTSSNKTAGPAIDAEAIGRIDLALVSHDQHADNLDAGGREVMARAEHVVTTEKGASRIAAANTRGLRAGQTITLSSEGKPDVQVTGTPARHGAVIAVPIVGPVVGFLVRVGDESIWITGDTVWYPALRRFARELNVDVAVVNAGGVKFKQTGPLRYTMTGSEAVELIALAKPRVAIPAHYEGWSHFRDGEQGYVSAVDGASPEVRQAVKFLPLGVTVTV